MVALQPLVSEFTIIGRLEDLAVSAKGKIKYLSLSTPEEDYLIAVAKQKALGKYLKPGCQLKVTGMRKYKLHQGVVEYKAYSIELLSEQHTPDKAMPSYEVCSSRETLSAFAHGGNPAQRKALPVVARRRSEASARLAPIATNKTKAKILVCQGSSCSKKGGQTICQMLQTELSANGITNKAKIQTTGCLKQCKQAPVLIMPVKKRYTQVKPEQVSKLVAKHFPKQF